MTSITTKLESSQPAAETAVYLFDHWFDPIETGLRDRVREFIHAMIEGELDMALSRPRYARHAKPSSGQAAGAVGATGHRRRGHRASHTPRPVHILGFNRPQGDGRGGERFS